VVAQPWRQAGKLGILSGLCVAPLRLGGLRGKQSTPSFWLGGTGEVSAVVERERHGAPGITYSGYSPSVPGTQVHYLLK
jgi:hypothetical protein